MVDAGSIWIRLGLDPTQLTQGLDKAKLSLTTWRDDTNKGLIDVAKWSAAFGAYAVPITAVGVAAYSTIEKFGGMAQEIKDLSYTTGLSTQKIQELQYAATLSGTQFSTVTMGIDNFTLAIAKAGDATSDQAKAFATLGVTTSGRTTDEILEDTFAALVNVKNETERNALAQTLYTRSWKEMMPYMEAYIKNSKEIKANPYLTDEELDANAEAKEQIDAIGKKWEIAEGKMVSYFTGLFENNKKAAIEAAKRDQAQYRPGDAAYAYSERVLEESDPDYKKAKESGNFKGTYSDFENFQAAMKAPQNNVNEGIPLSLSNNFVDKYKGMSDAEMELTDATTDLTTAQKAQKDALTQADYDKASEDVQKYQNKVEELTKSLSSGLTSAQNDYNSALEKMQDLNKDYGRDLRAVDIRDFSAVSDLYTKHTYAAEDQQTAINTAVAKVKSEQIKYGDLNVTLDGKKTTYKGVSAASPQAVLYDPFNLTQKGAD